MTPILVRPVREQLEHDRMIRLLQAKLKRRYDVVINVGEEKNAPLKMGTLTLYPDLVLTSLQRGRKLQAIVEVETTESINSLEAMAQWAHFGRARAAFHLYVPAGAVDMARRLCADNQIAVSEIWSYHSIGEQTRFTTVYRAPATPDARSRARGGRGARPKPRTARRRQTARRTKRRPSAARSTSAARARRRRG